MSVRTIRGVPDLHALATLAVGAVEYQARATAHRPRDASQLAVEVRRLHAAGLSARDVSVALRVPLPGVLEALLTTTGA